MSWFNDEDGHWDERSDDLDEEPPRSWPLDWRSLYPRERWLWFEQLWTDVCDLRERYRLAVRSGWWEDSLQVEALAALAAWVHLYDSGDWNDPPGKLALLYDLERVAVLLRDGGEPSHPDRDRNELGVQLHQLLQTWQQLRSTRRKCGLPSALCRRKPVQSQPGLSRQLQPQRLK